MPFVAKSPGSGPLNPSSTTHVGSINAIPANGSTKQGGYFSITPCSMANTSSSNQANVSNTTDPGCPLRRRSLSSPQSMDLFNVAGNISPTDSSSELKKHHPKKKKSNPFSKLFRKSSQTSSHSNMAEIEADEEQLLEETQRKAQLEFVHQLMTDPKELDSDLCHVDSEPDLVQTICAPGRLSKDAIRLDKKIYQIDVASARISTLSNLSETAVTSNDYRALEFLQNKLTSICKQQGILFQEADGYLTVFQNEPKKIMCQSNGKTNDSGGSPQDKVIFTVQPEDEEIEDLRWEASSLQLSTDTSGESEDDGPTPDEVKHLAKEVRKTEGTRFRKKLKLHHRKGSMKDDGTHLKQPPPPNPLGHTQRALMRSHTTVPSGLCQQSSSSLHCLTSFVKESPTAHHQPKKSNSLNLPFNLLSLTGQLSWLVSEYIPRKSSTYKWATDLIHSISRMSVTRSTWLNVHQQLRQTTELLYEHRDKEKNLTTSTTSKGEVAWNNIKMMHRAHCLGDGNMATVTANTSRQLLVSARNQSNDERELLPLSELMEKKLHLAYVCDLILWRAHKTVFIHQAQSPDDVTRNQLTDFRIRLMQLRLDQANVQHWTPEFIDWITQWISNAMSPNQRVKRTPDDNFCVSELKTLKSTIREFRDLVQNLCSSELSSDGFLTNDTVADGNDCDRSTSIDSQLAPNHHRHHHPHLHHQGESGRLQDLRPLDAERCSRTYSALVKQVNDHVMSKRPLSFFAERALYDIAIELDCPVDWKQRMNVLMQELIEAYDEWEQFLMTKFESDLYQSLFGYVEQSVTIR